VGGSQKIYNQLVELCVVKFRDGDAKSSDGGSLYVGPKELSYCTLRAQVSQVPLTYTPHRSRAAGAGRSTLCSHGLALPNHHLHNFTLVALVDVGNVTIKQTAHSHKPQLHACSAADGLA
jgi:hypothetical protein